MGKSKDKAPLKNRTAWNHLKAIDRAAEIVNSWPDWKRNVTLFRNTSDSSVEGTEVSSPPPATEGKRAA